MNLKVNFYTSISKFIFLINFYYLKKINIFLPGTGFFLRQIKRKFYFTYNNFKLEFVPSMASVYGGVVSGHTNEIETLNYLNNISINLTNYTFIDVGSCIGEFVFSNITRTALCTIAIDANIHACECIKKGVIINNINNVIVLNNAVSIKNNDIIDYFLDIKNPNESSIISSYKMKDIEKITINSISLDSIKDKIQGSNLVILIDVEGAELNVFKGAREIIEQYKPIIIFEYNYVSSKQFSLTDISEQLPIGYNFYNLDDKLLLQSENTWNIVAKFSKI